MASLGKVNSVCRVSTGVAVVNGSQQFKLCLEREQAPVRCCGCLLKRP